MASSSIQPVNNNFDPAQVASLNNNQITSLLVSGNLDPKFIKLLLSQMSDNNVNSILFGNENAQETSGNTGFDALGATGLVPSNIPTSNDISNSGNVLGSGSFTSITPQVELSVFSQLVGKTVSVSNPVTGKKTTDKVTSVFMQNGQIMLNVNGVVVPTTDLISVQQ